MAEMQCITGWSSACIQEKGLASLVCIKDLVKVPVREEEAASQPAVWFVTGEALEALEDWIVYELCCPLPIRW